MGRRQHFGGARLQGLEQYCNSRVQSLKAGSFKPGRSRYDRYVAASDQATFQHPNDIYRRYEAEEENTPQNLGTLRLWNFANCKDGRFQTEEGRAEIAGREGKVFYYLRDRNEDCENWILVPKAADPNRSVNYWEVYDRLRRLKRLRDFVSSEGANLSAQDRVELARQILARVAALHTSEAAHLDLGSHSVWLEAPSTVRISPVAWHVLATVLSLPQRLVWSLILTGAGRNALWPLFGALSGYCRRSCEASRRWLRRAWDENQRDKLVANADHGCAPV
jgi:hypothetical protein